MDTNTKMRLLQVFVGSRTMNFAARVKLIEHFQKSSNKMTLLYSIFIISCKSLYMFRVKLSPIIRSSIKLYLQHLVLTNRVWPAVIVDDPAM
jgi:hypothetical protein